MNRRQTVLLVEDDPELVRFAQVSLRMEGYRVLLAGDGERAMELARKRRPDLVVLDLRLPLADGWQVLAFIQGDPALEATPVVVLTATAGPRERERALAAGVADYLVKPVSADELLDAVARALAGRPTASDT